MDYQPYEKLGERIRRQKSTGIAEGSEEPGIFDVQPCEEPTGNEPAVLDPVFMDRFEAAESVGNSFDRLALSDAISNRSSKDEPDAVEATAPQGATSTDKSGAGSSQGSAAPA